MAVQDLVAVWEIRQGPHDQGRADPLPVEVAPQGRAHRIVHDVGLEFPNGTVITPDGATLIIAESRGRRLTAFDVAADGSLSGRRVFADLGEVVPDGICLDADGAVWVSNPRAPEVVRVLDGGAVTDRVSTVHNSYACMLGGAVGRRLFICSADGAEEDRVAGASAAYIEVATVAVPHAGLP